LSCIHPSQIARSRANAPGRSCSEVFGPSIA
jgi:hypothetical protein